MKTFELTMTLRNNLIKRRRLEMGLSPKEAADKAGVGYPMWLRYEAITECPIGERGEWKPTAERISEFLGVGISELFPEYVLAVKKPSVHVEIDAPEFVALSCAKNTASLLPAPDQALGNKETIETIRHEISQLPTSDRRIIRALFGFDGDEPKTSASVAKEYGLSLGRVHQAENAALRKIYGAIKKRTPPREDIKATISMEGMDE